MPAKKKTTTEFDTFRTEQMAILNGRIDEAKRSLKETFDTERSGRASYEPIIKAWDHPVVPVTINNAMNLFLDLAAADGANEFQVEYCQYLLVNIPGKNFCDAQWVVNSLEELAEASEHPDMPEVGMKADIGAIINDDIGYGEPPTGSSGGSGGPLVPANDGPKSGPNSGSFD